jgi:hypothetical protein
MDLRRCQPQASSAPDHGDLAVRDPDAVAQRRSESAYDLNYDAHDDAAAGALRQCKPRATSILAIHSNGDNDDCCGSSGGDDDDDRSGGDDDDDDDDDESEDDNHATMVTQRRR